MVGSTECGWEDVWVRWGCVQGTLLSCHLQTNHRMGRRREGVEVAPGGLERVSLGNEDKEAKTLPPGDILT